MKTLESMAVKGKQQRVNTPLWRHDLVGRGGCDRACAHSGRQSKEGNGKISSPPLTRCHRGSTTGMVLG